MCVYISTLILATYIPEECLDVHLAGIAKELLHDGGREVAASGVAPRHEFMLSGEPAKSSTHALVVRKIIATAATSTYAMIKSGGIALDCAGSYSPPRQQSIWTTYDDAM